MHEGVIAAERELNPVTIVVGLFLNIIAGGEKLDRNIVAWIRGDIQTERCG